MSTPKRALESVIPCLRVDSDVASPPSRRLTGTLRAVRIAATDPSLSVTYHCLYDGTTDVALKVFSFSSAFDPADKRELIRKVEYGSQVWRKLRHPNIVPFLGTLSGERFGSEIPCIVSTWMENKSLFEYINQRAAHRDSIRLISGVVSGLAYLHSQSIIHGNIYPGSILFDGDQQPRLTNFEFSSTLDQGSDQFRVFPRKMLWAAPELLYPELYPNVKFAATLQNDIYSLGSVIFFIFSAQFPWRDRGSAENELKKLKNPPRPAPPANIPDDVWSFIEQCWSPKDPRGRPSAQEALVFCANRLE